MCLWGDGRIRPSKRSEARQLPHLVRPTLQLRPSKAWAKRPRETKMERPESRMKAYITSMGKFLPGQPINNDAMEEFIGRIGGKASRARKKVLQQNGIHTRYYAIDREQKTL